MADISLTIRGTPSVIDLYADATPSPGLNLKVSSGYGTSDYTQLSNLPTLNGQTIIGDMVEIDPTVNDWAKSATKPNYTASEVNAVDADSSIPLEWIANLF